MNTKEDIIKKYKKYVLKKSVYSALSTILVYILIIFLISLTVTLGDIEKFKAEGLNVLMLHAREAIKVIYDLVPLKDNILTALGALVLTLFINVRSENKEINGKSGHEAAKARAYKNFSDIIIYFLGFIMFINFCTKAFLGDTINSNDQIYPWVSIFFMCFILIIRSLEGDSVDSVRKQILQAESRKSVINVHARNPINPKDSIKYNHILHHYEHSEPFLDPIRKGFGYVKLKYNIKNTFLKMLLQFLFILCIFCTTLSIKRIPYFPLVGQEYTLIQYSIHVFHQVPYIIPEDIILVCGLSIATSLILIFLDIGYHIISNFLNIHSENSSLGYLFKTFYLLTQLTKLYFLIVFPHSIRTSGSIYAFLEIPLFIYTTIILIIGYFIINNKLNRNYTQKLNQSLGLPINQSLNETKTSTELYYLNTKLESLDEILKTLLEETRDNSTQWKNSSNVDSDNINSSCE